MRERTLFAEDAWLGSGWASGVHFTFDEFGRIEAIETGREATGAPLAGGPVIPAIGNVHSHAFQRAMAGLTEKSGAGEDSFWTWREVMYAFLDSLTPDDLEAIAAQLYLEMLKSGYCAVGEFHYLHHDGDGHPYANRAEMGMRIVQAAEKTGISVTLLPVLYGYGGFGGREASQAQRRFLNSPEGYAKLLEALSSATAGMEEVRLGIAPHSLRAVTNETLHEAISLIDGIDPTAPIHIHIAEQVKEVEDCLEWSGLRPVQWLLESFGLSERWCLVHATHMTSEETLGLAGSGAVAGLCPTTEANLGDGFFPAAQYQEAAGAFGIGSDSHVSVSPLEELRWLEYGQRLHHRKRNVLSGGAQRSTGSTLYKDALKGGAQALGRSSGALEVGRKADLLVLDDRSPILCHRSGDALLDSLIFSGN
ncbi:MAG: formimidoylglutamate deiminase, partial [Kiloniellales bacterium]|nr:formimidoylglutamate deiminase [Kiloniellales bacterium]